MLSAMGLLIAAAVPAVWEPVALPAAVTAKLPAGLVARKAKCSHTLDPPHQICIVVAAQPDEVSLKSTREAPRRPLLIYRLAGTSATLIARNDRIVPRHDEGGQSDPMEIGDIAVKGRFFTLESGVAGGQHWTNFTTFRFDPRKREFLWHNAIYESLRFNPDNRPDADALVPDVKRVKRADPRRPITFSAYAPR